MKVRYDIKASVENCSHEFKVIESEYEKILKTKKVGVDFELLIKQFLSKLRSALDYLANQIADESSCKGTKTSFPIYSNSNKQFQQFMKEKFPNLENKVPNLFRKLETIQYYHNTHNNEWMRDLSILDNAYKHVQLEQQKIANDGGVIVKGKGITIIAREIIIGKGGSIIDADGKILKGPQKLNKDSKSISDNTGLLVASFKWDEVKFNKISKPVLPTLKSILVGVQNIITYF